MKRSSDCYPEYTKGDRISYADIPLKGFFEWDNDVQEAWYSAANEQGEYFLFSQINYIWFEKYPKQVQLNMLKGIGKDRCYCFTVQDSCDWCFSCIRDRSDFFSDILNELPQFFDCGAFLRIENANFLHRALRSVLDEEGYSYQELGVLKKIVLLILEEKALEDFDSQSNQFEALLQRIRVSEQLE